PRLTCLAFSPDGGTVAAGSWEGQIYLWSTADGERRLSIDAHQNRVAALEFNRAGTLLASVAWDSTFRLWDAATGQLIMSGPGASYQIQFAERDSQVGYANGPHISVFDVATHPGFRLLERAETDRGELGVRDLAFSPDGQLLAEYCRAGGIRFWNV